MASRSLARPALGASRRASFTTSSITRSWASTYTPSWQRAAKAASGDKPKSNFTTSSSTSTTPKPVAAATTSTKTAKTSPSLATPTSPKSTIAKMVPTSKTPTSSTTKPSPSSTPSRSNKTPTNTTSKTPTISTPAPTLSQELAETESQDPSTYAVMPVAGTLLSKQERAAAKVLTAPAHKPQPLVNEIDWVRSFHGISSEPFSDRAINILTKPLNVADIEVKPDGIVYLPEIKYRRILNAAFRPGGWAVVPRGDPIIHDRVVTREHALVVDGRFIAQAQGENTFFNQEGIPAAVEACKSNALMRCCKDIGIASELWDPVFIREFRRQHARQVWCEHVVNKTKRQLWHKVGVPVALPYKTIP
ncbi:mitochondrial genome maintenance MGM101-domain-containing protein [Plectosphaerella plurivora]|uniref:Mitochondrial genome maintenance protein MGM101 n=1 Tax=Plectosphaerella plurivora TaxID=936078 RepID=A0A9P8VG24_9PEZI|nr:mitochondrial genome maintenance MGM101-domain-containing protein [Plectosphaerella plurivora]